MSSGLLSRVSFGVGRARGVFLPFGLFAMLAVGIHVGCDRLADHLFVLLNVIDAALDVALTWAIQGVAGFFGASAETTDLWVYRATDLIDLELKSSAARLGALVLELLADLMLALPVFLYRERSGELMVLRVSASAMFRGVVRWLREWTVLKIAGPIAVACASIAGAFAIAREAQVLAHGIASRFSLSAEHATPIAGIAGLVALLAVGWRLGARAAIGVFGYAQGRAENDRQRGLVPRRRRLRGSLLALVALPIALLAFDATPIAGGIRALLWS